MNFSILRAHRQYINEGVNGSPLTAFAGSLISLEDKLLKANTPAADIKKAVDAATANRKAFIEGEDLVSDEKIMASVAMMYYNDIDKNQHPIGFYESLKSGYGDLKDEATFKKWAREAERKFFC